MLMKWGATQISKMDSNLHGELTGEVLRGQWRHLVVGPQNQTTWLDFFFQSRHHQFGSTCFLFQLRLSRREICATSGQFWLFRLLVVAQVNLTCKVLLLRKPHRDVSECVCVCVCFGNNSAGNYHHPARRRSSVKLLHLCLSHIIVGLIT